MPNVTKTLKSVKGRRMRITRLSPTGDPVVGACSSVVTDGFISVTVSQEVEAGEEITQANAWGDNCIQDKAGDLIKWVNVSMSFCLVDPDILDIIGGATPLATGTAPNQTFVGASFGPTPNVDHFAIEVWTKKVNDPIISPTEWGYLLVPNIQNGRVDGDLSIQNGALTIGLTGQGIEATADWGVGPYADNPLLVTAGMPVGDQFALVTTTVQPPAVTSGCAAIA